MNVQQLVKESIGKMKTRQEHITKAHISNFRISRFLNERGGLDCFEFTRLLLAMGFKIIDKNGNTVLGQTGKVEGQIKENVLLPIQDSITETQDIE